MAGLFRRGKKNAQSYCTAIVVAAGSSTRMNGLDKILLTLREQPLIVHTLRALESCPTISEIIVVTREDLIVPISRLCSDHALTKVRKVVSGGATRVHSVQCGLAEVSKRTELIAIHDGARPLVTSEVIEDAIRTADRCGAAAPAIPVKDTVKRAVNGVVSETLERSELFAVQTPQVFEADLIRAAIYHAVENDLPLTDDCSAVERLGMKVVLTRGSEENIKITTPADVIVAEAILAERGMK